MFQHLSAGGLYANSLCCVHVCVVYVYVDQRSTMNVPQETSPLFWSLTGVNLTLI